MEAKKNSPADIHQHRSKFFLVGLMISLSLVITAFEWRTALSDGAIVRKIDSPFETLAIIPVTQIDHPKMIAPPEVVKPKQALISSTTLNPISITSVPDNPQTESPIVNTEDPSLGVVIPIEPEIDSTVCVIFAEHQPTPVGGFKTFYEIISRNIKYPRVARNIGTEGKVFVEFVVDRQGNPTNFKIIRGIGAGCDEEAIRVAGIPKWEPGKQRGKPVNVRMVLPINFTLNR